MNLSEVVATLLRRWPQTLFVVLLAVMSGAGVFATVGPTYAAEGSAVLVPPPTIYAGSGSAPAPANPLLYLGGLNQSRDVVVRTLGSREFTDELVRAFPTTTISVVGDTTSSAPIIIVTAEADTAEEALAARTFAVDRVSPTLQSIQEGLGIAKDARIAAMTITSDEAPTTARKKQIQLAAAALGMVALAGFTGLMVLDSLTPRWRRTQGSARPTETATARAPRPPAVPSDLNR